MKFRRAVAVAATATTALAGAASSASAAQTTDLHYQCTFPLIGKRLVDVKLAVDQHTSGWQTSFSTVATIDGRGLADLTSIDQLSTIEGKLTTTATAIESHGGTFPAGTRAQFPPTVFPADPHQPWDLVASGSSPALTLLDPETTGLTLRGLSLNLRLRYADGQAVTLPERNWTEAERAFLDPDDDPTTFDVACDLSPDDQNTTIWDPGYMIPEPEPTPAATLTPTPAPNPGETPAPTPTPAPATPTATPTPPLPTPDGSLNEPLQCKWPLLGIQDHDVAVKFGEPAADGAPIPFEVWLLGDREQGDVLFDVTNASGYGGTIGLSLRADGGPVVDVSATVDNSGNDVSGRPSIHATGTLPAGALAGAPEQASLVSVRPRLILFDPFGDVIELPPLGSGIGGAPLPTPDGDPSTFDLSCALPNVPVVTPTPTATATPKPGNTPTPTPTPGSNGLHFQCKFPLIGIQPANVNLVLAPQTPQGLPTGPTPFTATATISLPEIAEGLDAIDGLQSIEGTARAGLSTETIGGGRASSQVVATIASVPITHPAENPLVLTATGTAHELTFDGMVGTQARLDQFALNLIMRDPWGNAIPLPPVSSDPANNPVGDSDGDPDTFDVYCTLESGQNPLIPMLPAPPTGPSPTVTPNAPTPSTQPTGTPVPTPPPTANTSHLSYSLSGSTTINTLTKGTMPLTGSVDAELDVSTGDYTATTAINDTQGRVWALNFLPVSVVVGVVPSGATTGTLDDDHLTANLNVRIKVKSMKTFGVIPIAGGNTCQTKQLSALALASTDPFDATGTGGTIAGTYTISDLNGCGPFTGIVNPLTAGSGNTISVKLTPKRQ